MYVADLHIHSTASDGLLTPTDIIKWGANKGLKALSITDHDSVAGVCSVFEYSKEIGIELIPGIELSTEYEGSEVHILGYFIDYKDELLDNFLNKLINSRIDRAHKMIKKLNSLGYNIIFDDICEVAKDAKSIGRPHVARVMVKYGYCKSIEEVFEKFIGYGKPAYIERYKISPFEAVELIKKCHGVSSIAHPGLIVNINKQRLIKKLKSWGLQGIEVYHTRHSIADVHCFEEIAKENGLIATGGTDCHGVMINGEPIIGAVTVPYDNVEKLRTYAR